MRKTWSYRNTLSIHIPHYQTILRLSLAGSWCNFQFWSFHWLCSPKHYLGSSVAELHPILHRRNFVDDRVWFDLRILRPSIWQETRTQEHGHWDGTRSLSHSFGIGSIISWMFCNRGSSCWLGSAFLSRIRRSWCALCLADKDTRYREQRIMLGQILV